MKDEWVLMSSTTIPLISPARTDLGDEWTTRCLLSSCASLETPSALISASSFTVSQQSLERDSNSCPAAWWTSPRAIFSLASCFLDDTFIRRRLLGFVFPTTKANARKTASCSVRSQTACVLLLVVSFQLVPFEIGLSVRHASPFTTLGITLYFSALLRTAFSRDFCHRVHRG